MKTLNNMETAEAIANNINNRTQSEIEAMISIACEIHDEDYSSMYRLVGNFYGKIRNQNKD